MTSINHIEYDRLRTQADDHLTFETLAQLMSAKLPKKPGVSEAWEAFCQAVLAPSPSPRS